MLLFYNDRNLPNAVGIIQHGFHFFGISLNIMIRNLPAKFSKRFPSRRGIGSRIFAENQYLIRHGPSPLRKLIYNVVSQYPIKIQAIAIHYIDKT
jgi:hypothetical protein